MKGLYLKNDTDKHLTEVDDVEAFNKERNATCFCDCGLCIPGLQILQSAAGYFIGTAIKADWYKTGDTEFWEPNYRDSQHYWPTWEMAAIAFTKGNYEVKF